MSVVLPIARWIGVAGDLGDRAAAQLSNPQPAVTRHLAFPGRAGDKWPEGPGERDSLSVRGVDRVIVAKAGILTGEKLAGRTRRRVVLVERLGLPAPHREHEPRPVR